MQEGGRGSQYVVPVPEVTLFTAAGMGARADQLLGVPAGASDQRQPSQQQQQQKTGSFEEQRRPMRGEGVDLDALAKPEASEGAEFPDEDAAVLADVAAGEEAERAAAGNGGGGGGGNRWPPEETLALLRIRSEMDAAFRDASLKGPLWEDVSRKLAELGYKRSSKKCREKFENVHKYYKRTREGRAGRQDGKSYKFFTQLEALNARGGGGGGGGGGAPAAATIPAAAVIGMVGSVGKLQPTPLNAIPLSVGAVDVAPPVASAGSPAVSHPSGGVSFSSNNSSSASGSEEEDTEEGHAGEPRKRKRAGRDGGGEVGVGLDSGGAGERRKMVAFFEGLMRQVVERQEAMQQKLLEMIEKREQDRMIREEAWRRQEMARLTREHEAMAQEREIAAARDATIIAFLQKVTGQTVPTPILPAVVPAYPVAAQPLSQLQQAPPPGGHQPQAQQQQRHSNYRHGNELVRTRPASPQQVAVAPSTEEQEAAGAAAGAADPASARWPKSEVFALIKLRSEMEIKYQEAGPKGPLWEEIAAGMRRMGYSRSAKRCKEKWENINKYFKKVKDISKKRPEDAKTCPYFHELDALYRRKVLISGAGASFGNNHVAKQKSEGSPFPAAASPALQLALPHQSYQAKAEVKTSHVVGDSGHMNNGSTIKPDGNGALTEKARHLNGSTAQDEGVRRDGTSKEPEDAVRGPADRRQHGTMVDYDKMEETESDSMDLQGEEDEEEEYRVEYHQRPAGVNGAGTASNGTAAGGNSFMAMVQ